MKIWVAITVDLYREHTGFIEPKVNVVGAYRTEDEALEATKDCNQCWIREVEVKE